MSGGGLVGIVAQVIHDFLYGVADLKLLLAGKSSLSGIRLREHQGFHRHRVVICRERLALQLLFGLVRGFGGIAGEQTLIEALFRFQRGLVAEQHVDEVQRIDVLAKHDEAHRQRCCQQKADGSPENRPEQRGDDDGDRRKAGVLAIKHRLHNVSGDRLGDEEERRRP